MRRDREGMSTRGRNVPVNMVNLNPVATERTSAAPSALDQQPTIANSVTDARNPWPLFLNTLPDMQRKVRIFSAGIAVLKTGGASLQFRGPKLSDHCNGNIFL